MKAVMYEAPRVVSFRDVPEPSFDSNTILINISYSFICATDIKTYKQGHPHIIPPTILGHEFTGVIERVGENVEGYAEGSKEDLEKWINILQKGPRSSFVTAIKQDWKEPQGKFKTFQIAPSD